MSVGVDTRLPGTLPPLRSSRRTQSPPRPLSTAEIIDTVAGRLAHYSECPTHPTPLPYDAFARSDPLGGPPRSGCLGLAPGSRDSMRLSVAKTGA